MYQLTNLISLPVAGRGENYLWYGSANCARLDFTDASLRNLKGTFSIVAETEDSVLLACDFVRSIPVLYTVTGNEIAVDFNGLTMIKRYGLKVDPAAREEFLHTSYTIGTRTLFKGVYTVLPGELVRISKLDGSISRHFYWELNYTCDARESLPELIDAFDDCLRQVFQDLISRLDGRTALVPLSGGCDSRTVAVMLKRLGYEKVICFTFGRPGNSEAVAAERVAKALGYPWECIDYDAGTWKALYGSEDYESYLAYTCCASGIAGIHALPAVQRLREKYGNCVVIPGHTLDVIMGSHIPTSWRDGQLIDKAALANLIVRKHYNLRRHPERCDISAWKDRLPERMTPQEAVQALQCFEWQNRQTKFIVNGLRKYDYLHFAGTEIPLWDRRVCEFAARLPVNLLQGRRFQYEYTMERIDPFAGIHQDYNTPQPLPEAAARKKRQSRLCERMPGCAGARRIFRRIQARKRGYMRCLHERKHNILAVFDSMSLPEYLHWMWKAGTSFKSQTKVAEDTLRTIERKYAK